MNLGAPSWSAVSFAGEGSKKISRGVSGCPRGRGGFAFPGKVRILHPRLELPGGLCPNRFLEGPLAKSLYGPALVRAFFLKHYEIHARNKGSYDTGLR